MGNESLKVLEKSLKFLFKKGYKPWVSVVVQFYPWFKFYFPLCLGIVMYDNEVTTKGNKIKPRMKLNHNSYLGEHNNLDPPPIPLSKVSVWVVFCYWLEKRHLIA